MTQSQFSHSVDEYLALGYDLDQSIAMAAETEVHYVDPYDRVLDKARKTA